MRADVVITEGIAGVWFYHLSQRGATTRSLCGAPTMPTMIPLSTWGHSSHLRERYCRHCEGMAAESIQKAGQ
jgi:hypothetical protein